MAPKLRAPNGDWRIRPFDLADVPYLARQANDARVASMLQDRFPHPYDRDDAEEWITFTASQEPRCNFAIAAEGRVIGGIGLMLGQDIYARGAEMGYWLGHAYWGKGIASWAVEAFSGWALDNYDLLRLEARVFANNPASARVLEKCGFEREGTLRQAVFKQRQVLDVWLYARVRDAG